MSAGVERNAVLGMRREPHIVVAPLGDLTGRSVALQGEEAVMGGQQQPIGPGGVHGEPVKMGALRQLGDR